MALPSSADIPVESRRPHIIKPRRKSTIDSAILSPGAVRINFQGAFIVDEEPLTSSSSADEGSPPRQSPPRQNHATQGIRLPNHKAIVSHVALDASASFLPFQ
jgi:type II pantothenate kinase